MDIKKIESNLPIIYKTGKVLIGFNNVKWALNNEPNKVKAVLLARNIPEEYEEEIMNLVKSINKKIPIIKLTRTNIEIGDLCGRPHSISALVIYDIGSAPISEDIFHG